MKPKTGVLPLPLPLPARLRDQDLEIAVVGEAVAAQGPGVLAQDGAVVRDQKDGVWRMAFLAFNPSLLGPGKYIGDTG